MLLCFMLIVTTQCKHTPTNRPLLSIRGLLEVYKEVGELFEISIFVSESATESQQNERPRMRLRVLHADGQISQVSNGEQEVQQGVAGFKDVHIATPCLQNCRLQAELDPQQATDGKTPPRAVIEIPLRVVAASWTLNVVREGKQQLKLIVTHQGEPAANLPAVISACIPPCIPWRKKADANSLLNARDVELDELGSWQGKLARAVENDDNVVVYVKVAGRVLYQKLPPSKKKER